MPDAVHLSIARGRHRRGSPTHPRGFTSSLLRRSRSDVTSRGSIRARRSRSAPRSGRSSTSCAFARAWAAIWRWERCAGISRAAMPSRASCWRWHAVCVSARSWPRRWSLCWRDRAHARSETIRRAVNRIRKPVHVALPWRYNACMATDTATIRVTRETRDLLARQASKRGVSLSAMLSDLAQDVAREGISARARRHSDGCRRRRRECRGPRVEDDPRRWRRLSLGAERLAHVPRRRTKRRARQESPGGCDFRR